MPNDTFAGNRARGRVAFTVTGQSGRSRRGRVHEAGSLRVRFPNGDGKTLDAVMVNTAGGMTGGDRFEIEVKVGAEARLILTTAAAEKVYRSLGAYTEIAVKLEIGAGGTLAWLPQETIVFDQVRLRRSIEVDIQPGGRLLLAEAIVFGRSAMGETVAHGSLTDRWRIRVGGALAFAETVRLDGAIAQSLGLPAIAAGSIAIASVIKFPGDDKDVAAVRALADNFGGEVGASAWNGLAVARLVGRDGAILRRDLISVLTALSDAPLPRLWLN